MDKDNQISVRMGNGQLVKCVGKVILNIRLSDGIITHSFLVLDEMNCEIILGIDFLRGRWSVNLLREVLCSEEEKVPLIFNIQVETPVREDDKL